MMRFKRIVCVVAVCTIICSLMACGKSRNEDSRTPVTVGCVGLEDESAFNYAVTMFEEKYPDYRIELKQYGNETSAEDPYEKMVLDITSGKCPDVIALSGMPLSQFVNAGVLEDLTPYFEKDADISTDDIVEPVKNAMLRDGKLYYVADGFGLSEVFVKASETDDGEWNIDKIYDYVMGKPDNIQVFRMNTKLDILRWLVGGTMKEYLDWDKGECSFDNEDFRKILEIANRGWNEDDDLGNADMGIDEMFRDGRMCFVDVINGNMTDMVSYYRVFNHDIKAIGFPSSDGSEFVLNGQYAMYSGSENKDMAWEFLKIFMSKKYQYKAANIFQQLIPTRKDNYDMYVKSITETEPYTDEMGNNVEPYSGSLTFEGSEFSYDQEPLTEDEIRWFTGLMEDTHVISEWNDDILEIICEEADMYFQGNYDEDEAVDHIQSRVSIYLAERKHND